MYILIPLFYIGMTIKIITGKISKYYAYYSCNPQFCIIYCIGQISVFISEGCKPL